MPCCPLVECGDVRVHFDIFNELVPCLRLTPASDSCLVERWVATFSASSPLQVRIFEFELAWPLPPVAASSGWRVHALLIGTALVIIGTALVDNLRRRQLTPRPPGGGGDDGEARLCSTLVALAAIRLLFRSPRLPARCCGGGVECTWCNAAACGLADFPHPWPLIQLGSCLPRPRYGCNVRVRVPFGPFASAGGRSVRLGYTHCIKLACGCGCTLCLSRLAARTLTGLPASHGGNSRNL